MSASGLRAGQAATNTAGPSQRAVATAAAAVAVLVLTGITLPYLVNWVLCPADEFFVGLVDWLPDQLSYLAWMRQGAAGGPFYDLYTSDPHPPLQPPLFFAALGYLAGLLHAPVVAVYHAARILSAIAYMWILWAAVGAWVVRPLHRLVAFSAIALGSGLGVVAAAAGQPWLGADLFYPELWSFASMFYFPHFTASLLLVALIWLALGRLWLDGAPMWPWAAAVAAASALLAVVHPYTWLPLALAVGFYAVFGRAKNSPSFARRLAAFGGVMAAVPVLAWLALGFRSHPILRQWAEQNVLPPPLPHRYAVGFGVFLVAAAVEAVVARRRLDPVRHAFPAAWVLLAFLLTYSYPVVPFARRCMEGAHVPLVLFCVGSLAAGARRLAEGGGARAVGGRRKRCSLSPALVVWLALLCLAPTSLYVAVNAAVAPSGRISVDMVRAWRFIERSLPPDAAILCTPTVGMYIPAMTGKRVWIGHFHLTLNYRARLESARRFFRNRPDRAFRRKLIEESGCRWVLLGRRAPALEADLTALLGPPVRQWGAISLFSVGRQK